MSEALSIIDVIFKAGSAGICLVAGYAWAKLERRVFRLEIKSGIAKEPS